MNIDIRPLGEADLEEADRIFRLAFGTFLGLPDPLRFAEGADLVASRWRAREGTATLGAFEGGRMIGSNIVTRWGTFGFFGPLTVLPSHWDKGVARLLLDRTTQVFEEWGVRAAGLYTFPQSPKHLALYQKYDFWPQHLTAIMAKPVATPAEVTWQFNGPRPALLKGAREVTDGLYPGLDLSGEINSLLDQKLGEIVVVGSGDAVDGFAVCHVGPGSEAVPGEAYIKFAAVRPSKANAFGQLMAACERCASDRGVKRLVAGVNAGTPLAYRAMIDLGFRTQLTGVAMQRGNSAGYLSQDAIVVGDWR